MGFHYKKASLSNPKNLAEPTLDRVDHSIFLVHATTVWLFSTSTRYNINTIFVEKVFWAKFALLLKTSFPSKLPYLVDGAQFSGDSESWTIQFNFNSMLSDTRLHAYTCLPVGQHSVVTTSTVFKSSSWLERELSDFTNVHFTGLTDTRRLLLDYFEEKQAWQTHIANDKNFNNIFYDITLNY